MFEKTIPLNEFITLQRGFDLPKSKRQEGSIPVIASTGIAGYHNEAKVKPPGVVIGRSGSIGGGQYIEEDYWPLNTSLWVKDFKGHHPKYVYYLMKSIDFSGFNAGTGVPTLNRNHLSSLLVADIGYEREKEIADALSALDDKISNNTAMNATLEKIAQRIFKSWFVNFDPVKANAEGLPFDGLSPEIQALFPNEFEESELGMIPKGWEVTNIEHFINSLSKGTTPTKKDLSLATDETVINYLKVRDISNTGLISSELDKIPASLHETKLKRSILKTNDIIVSIAGTIGRVTTIPDWLDNSNCNQAVCFIRLHEDSYYHDYIRVLLNQKSTQEYFYSSVVQGVQANISLAVVKSTPVIKPSDQVIKNWKKIISPIMQRMDLNNNQNNHLVKIRDKLLPRLISGKITIQKAEELLEEAS